MTDALWYAAGLFTLPVVGLLIIAAITLADKFSMWRTERQYRKTWRKTDD